VRDICPGKCRSDPSDFLGTASGGLLVSAGDERHGREPWLTNGTWRGTTRLRDVFRGRCSSSASGFVRIRPGSYLFQAYDRNGQSHPWVAHEEAADALPLGHGLGYVTEEVRVGGRLAFGSSGALWRTDGTRAGTIRLTPR
jgi:ELWxxDGT repeat protein